MMAWALNCGIFAIRALRMYIILFYSFEVVCAYSLVGQQPARYRHLSVHVGPILS